ncbi:hypothetical protein [Caproiciproducens sp. LBM24188]
MVMNVVLGVAGWLGLLLGILLLAVLMVSIAGIQPKRQTVRYLDETERELQLLEAAWEAGRISTVEYRARRAALMARYR